MAGWDLDPGLYNSEVRAFSHSALLLTLILIIFSQTRELAYTPSSQTLVEWCNIDSLVRVLPSLPPPLSLSSRKNINRQQ